MKSCYEKNGRFDSNNRIFDAYFQEEVLPANGLQRVLDTLSAFLFAVIAFLSCAAFRRVVRVSGVALSLVGFIGVIGAMQNGSVSLMAGLFIGALLLGVEYLCLRSPNPKKVD